MPASFPVTFPSALSITGAQTLEAVGHTNNLHIKDRDEIIATQTKLGLGSSVASGTTVLLGTGGTQSAWAQITNAYIAGTAAIAISKLGTVAANSALVSDAGGTITAGSITNTHIAGTAAIAISKLGTVAANSALVSDAGGTITASTITNTYISDTAGIFLKKIRGSGVGARKVAAQSIPHATMTPVTFDQEYFDVVNSGDTEIHSTTSDTSRFYARYTGIWLIFDAIALDATGVSTEPRIYKNGSVPLAGMTIRSTQGSTLTTTMNMLVQLNAGDYVEAMFWHNAGTAKNVGDYGDGTYFFMVYLGAS
jgi:hypothetical protein